jgi:hypothetical protein
MSLVLLRTHWILRSVMNIDPGLWSLLIVGVVGIVLLSPVLLSRLRSKEERHQVPLLEERCSIRRGVGLGLAIGGNVPLWRCSLYDSFMVINMVSPIVIRYQEIDRVEQQISLLSPSVRIVWHGGRRNETIRIFTSHADKIEKLIKERIDTRTEQQGRC